MGYHNIGLNVVGVDIAKQPNYPFDFIQADALTLLPKLINNQSVKIYKTRDRAEQLLGSAQFTNLSLNDISFIHASPPCQAYSVANNVWGHSHPDIIAPLRELLIQTKKPYVIENVVPAPLLLPVVVCGLSLGLPVKRHRKFESNCAIKGTPECGIHYGPWITIWGRAVRKAGTEIGFEAGKAAMGVTWCKNREELSQSIPPAYTEFIGKQLINAAA